MSSRSRGILHRAAMVGFLVAAALVGRGLAAGAQEEVPIRCSIINLLATPAEYDGKRIQVVGYAKIRFEGNALYLSQADSEHEVVNNSLWLDFSGWGDRGSLEDGGNGYVIVEGTFKEAAKGHMGMWPGGITQIERFDPWPPPSIESP